MEKIKRFLDQNLQYLVHMFKKIQGVKTKFPLFSIEAWKYSSNEEFDLWNVKLLLMIGLLECNVI